MTKPKSTAAKDAPPAPRAVARQADIHQSIYDAIVEHRLLPGTKLSEERVAELFAVSRTQVRAALQRLAVEQLITLIPNRGAFVTTPSAEEAHDVLSVRRTLEPAAVVRLIERIAAGKAPTAIKHLRALVKREHKRRRENPELAKSIDQATRDAEAAAQEKRAALMSELEAKLAQAHSELHMESVKQAATLAFAQTLQRMQREFEQDLPARETST